MAKFVIACPSCGKYAEASTGFFAKKKINCPCGHVINVKTEKLAARKCPHCERDVVFDQSKGKDAVCPVCNKPINAHTKTKKEMVEFSCPFCSCMLTTEKGVKEYTCPLCDTEIDVKERLEKEKVKNQGHANLIKYEGGNDVFVWKHPIEDFNLGSQLVVHESQEAIFLRDGKALDAFGAGRYTLATSTLPKLDEVYKLPDNNEQVVHSEVYFVNMTTQMGIKWGTDSKVRLFDPGSGLHIEIGACGSFNLRVCDSRKLLLKLVGTTSEFTQLDVTGAELFGITFVVGKFKALIMSKVKASLAKVIKENNVNILEVDEYIDVLSEKMGALINETLEEYGLTMPEFYITSVLTPDDDPNFKRLKQQFAEKTLLIRQEEIRKAEAEAAHSRKLVEAQSEAQLKMLDAQGDAEVLKIKAQAEAEAYRAQAFAEADEMRAKGYTYTQETARMVGMEAMKNGITGNGSAMGDVASLGITLGAMGGVIDMTKEAFNPLMSEAGLTGHNAATSFAQTATAQQGWSCACGQQNITSNFCPSCGAKKPEAQATWNCVCGQQNITSNFCPECGAKKPEAPATWNCACGEQNITSKFCPSCGAKKPEAPATWNCACGEQNITSNFCPSCGAKKAE